MWTVDFGVLGVGVFHKGDTVAHNGDKPSRLNELYLAMRKSKRES